MTNMSVASATAGCGNAVYHSKPQTTGNFNNILQEQISKIGSEDEVPENIPVGLGRMEFPTSSILQKSRRGTEEYWKL
jgi:hypothetical protein